MLPGGLPASPAAAAQPEQEEQSLAEGSWLWCWRRSSPSRHRALPCSGDFGDEARSLHRQLQRACSPPAEAAAAPWGTAVPCHFLLRCQPAAGCKQCVARRKCCVSCTGVGGSLCCSFLALGLAPALSCCPWAALKRGALALLAPSPALSLLPELLSLHKYAFINQAVFV